MSSKKEEKFYCLGCAKERGLSQLKRILVNPLLVNGIGWLRANPGKWACDICLRNGRALIANPQKQVFGLGSPYLAYVDRECKCSACSRLFKFSAREHRYWLESLKFHIDSEPVRCPDCRRFHREQRELNTRLSELLENKAELTAEKWLLVSEIYRKMGKEDKAIYAQSQVTRLKNK
jgi:hypothetical protein